jgi:hypothetical protein
MSPHGSIADMLLFRSAQLAGNEADFGRILSVVSGGTLFLAPALPSKFGGPWHRLK